MPRRRAGRRLGVGAIAAVVCLALAGCVGPGSAGEPAARQSPVQPTAGRASTAAASPPAPPTPAAPAPPSAPSAPSTEPPLPVLSPSAPPARVAGVVRAAGVRQWIHCAGEGPVTFVVVPGLGSTAGDWAAVRPGLQRLSRTCVYDRPGLGRSPARAGGRGRVDAGLYARELAALLTAADQRGPYVVVGHSFGGLVARAFVRRNRDRVAGVYLLESVTPFDPTLGDFWTEAGMAVDLAASSRSTGGGPRLGDVPLLVMTASRADADHLTGPAYGQAASVTAEWLAGQRRNLSLSSDAIQVVAHSGHVIQQDAPDTFLEGARVLLHDVVTGQPLRCSPVWQRNDAACRRP